MAEFDLLATRQGELRKWRIRNTPKALFFWIIKINSKLLDLLGLGLKVLRLGAWGFGGDTKELCRSGVWSSGLFSRASSPNPHFHPHFHPQERENIGRLLKVEESARRLINRRSFAAGNSIERLRLSLVLSRHHRVSVPSLWPERSVAKDGISAVHGLLCRHLQGQGRLRQGTTRPLTVKKGLVFVTSSSWNGSID